MDKGFLQATVEQREKWKKQSDRGLKVFLLVFIAGYLFFFSSRYFFPKIYKGVEAAPIGTVTEMGDYTFTLDAWDYAPKDRAFEILLDVLNVSLDREPKYIITCRAGDEIYKSEVYRQMDDMLVVRVYDISPRWTEVSLTISVGNANYKIGMNDKSVANIGHLSELTDTAYKIHACQSRIAGYEKTLAELEATQAKKEADIEYSYTKLADLTAKKAAQTQAERTETEKSIQKLSTTQVKLQSELEQIALDEKALKDKIAAQNNQLIQLGG